MEGNVFAPQGKGDPVSLHSNHRAQKVGGYFGLYSLSDYGGTTNAPNAIANLAAKTVAIKFNPFTSWNSSNVYAWCMESGGDIYAYIKPTSATTIVVSISNADFGATPATRTYTVPSIHQETFVLVWNNGLNFTAFMGGKKLEPSSSSNASTPTYLRGGERFFYTADFRNGHGGVHAIARFAAALPDSLARYISEDIYNLSPRAKTVVYFGGGASPQTVSVTNTSETDSAKSITAVLGARVVTVTNASETNAAQAITARGSYTGSLSPALETEAAQVISVVSALTLSVTEATETDAAQAITAIVSGATSGGHATETDAAQTITPVPGAVTVAVGAATESDAAQAITALNGLTISLGAATEVGTVGAITPVPGGLIVTLNPVSETDESQAVQLITSGSFTAAQLQEILAYVEANMAVPTTAQIAAAVWAEVLEGTLTAEQMQRIMLAALAGKRAGLGTATEQYMAQDNVTPRITFTPIDEHANGTTVVDGS